MASKYEALEIHLRSLPASKSEITLTFAEIEAIIEAALPLSHLNHREWWGNQNDTTRRPHARAWMNAGFKVDELRRDKDNGWVQFVRR